MKEISYEKTFDLGGRIGIVTGGAGVLGRTFLKGLLAHGASGVVVADLDEVALKDVEMAHAGDGRVLVLKCDVSDPLSVKTMVDRTVERFGKVDFLLNNAAIGPKDPQAFFAPFEEYSLKEWRRVSSVNLDGVFLVAQAVGRQMVKQGTGGSIVQTSSIYGVMAADNRIYEGSTFKNYPINNPAVYCATKSGVVGLTRWLSTYWAKHNIRVNAIAPGGVFSHENENFVKKYSQRVPLGRMAQQDEIFGSALFLVSDASTYVTGQCLLIDGGLSAW